MTCPSLGLKDLFLGIKILPFKWQAKRLTTGSTSYWALEPLAFKNLAPAHAIAAAMAVDAIIEAPAATHIPLAGASSSPPPRTVAAATAADATVETSAASRIVEADSFFLILLSLLLNQGLARSLGGTLLQQPPTHAVAAAMAVDAVIEAPVAAHVLPAHAATVAPLRAVAAAIAADAIEEAVAAVRIVEANALVSSLDILRHLLSPQVQHLERAIFAILGQLTKRQDRQEKDAQRHCQCLRTLFVGAKAIIKQVKATCHQATPPLRRAERSGT